MWRVPEATSNRIERLREIPCFRGKRSSREKRGGEKNKEDCCDFFSSKFFTVHSVSSSLSLSLSLYETRLLFFLIDQSRLSMEIKSRSTSKRSFHNLSHVIGRHAFREKRKRRRPAAVLSNAKVQRQVSRR